MTRADARSGPALFARYAYPPNSLGYCGPDDHGALLALGAAETGERQLAQLARGFEGAWPYLELIATSNGMADPLDRRVVEAYWIGNRLLDRVTPANLGDSLDARFRRRLGRHWPGLAAAVPAGAQPHHSFHVFSVYPWLGLMRTGVIDEPLRVLDRCRIRWARVDRVAGDMAAVTFRPLRWDGGRLVLGDPAGEWARVADHGTGFVRRPAPGDWVALHWDWVCDRLTTRQLRWLRSCTVRQLEVANGLPAPGAARVLG